MSISKLVYMSFALIFTFVIINCSKDEDSPSQPVNEAPFFPSNPSPADCTLEVEPDVVLTWSCQDPDNDSLTYFLHFGQTLQPPVVQAGLEDTFYTIEDLELGANYYWKVVAHDNNGHLTSGPVWLFTTRGNAPPFQPTSPVPADSQTNVGLINTELRWISGDPDNDVLSFDIYFGTNSRPSLLTSGYHDTSYTIHDLLSNNTYYWRIVAWDSEDNTISSPTWSFSTPTVTSWMQTYGGDDDEWSQCIRSKPGGGYLLAGGTKSYGNGGADFWLLSIDSDGNEEWSQTYGTANDDYVGSKFDFTPDGGVILAGYTRINNEETNTFLVKTDAQGNEEWTQTIDNYENNEFWSIQNSDDGGYYIVGRNQSENEDQYYVWLVKSDSDGEPVWETSFHADESYSWGYDILVMPDNDILILGNMDHPGSDSWLINVSPLGLENWRKQLEDVFLWGRRMVSTFDGNISIVGDSRFDSRLGVSITKTDINGNHIWGRFLTPDEMDERGTGICQTSEGGYIVTGYSESDSHERLEIVLYKLDVSGNVT
ncbi:MAG: hypothetical protein P9L92_04740 [Candidatus Electryonea clarkiae]|nr:hypothetical protein [Candidatus Electryonea clarkiae]MDP8288472.1 hypothetical protein [Candidatus Electryonea clarkiae]